MFCLERVENIWNEKPPFRYAVIGAGLCGLAAGVWYMKKAHLPIDFNSHDSSMPQYPSFRFQNYYRKLVYMLKSTEGGTEIEISSQYNPEALLPTLSGGILEADYVLNHVEFHWPSVHGICGKAYPMETHFVHYKSSLGSFDEALNCKNKDSVVIVAVFYHLVDSDSPDPLDSLTEDIKSLMYPDEMSFNKSLPLRCLLPKRTSKYYTYTGTTSESSYKNNVRFIVFEKSASLTWRQYKIITSLKDEFGDYVERSKKHIELASNIATRIVYGREASLPIFL